MKHGYSPSPDFIAAIVVLALLWATGYVLS
jgi:hypothetical protein